MRGPLIGGKDFPTSIGQGSKLKEGSWRGTKGEEEYLVFWGKTKEKNGNLRKIFSS
jgi:hypothetical protein